MKAYMDRGVQAGSSQLQSRALPLDAELLSPSPKDSSLFAIGDSQFLSPLTPSLQVSPAYSHLPARGSSVLKTEFSGTDTTSGICFSSHTRGTIPHTPSPPPSPDSVLIIENNCGLSEAFLSNQHPNQASSPGSEMKVAPTDEGKSLNLGLMVNKI